MKFYPIYYNFNNIVNINYTKNEFFILVKVKRTLSNLNWLDLRLRFKNNNAFIFKINKNNMPFFYKHFLLKKTVNLNNFLFITVHDYINFLNLILFLRLEKNLFLISTVKIYDYVLTNDQIDTIKIEKFLSKNFKFFFLTVFEINKSLIVLLLLVIFVNILMKIKSLLFIEQ